MLAYPHAHVGGEDIKKCIEPQQHLAPSLNYALLNSANKSLNGKKESEGLEESGGERGEGREKDRVRKEGKGQKAKWGGNKG